MRVKLVSAYTVLHNHKLVGCGLTISVQGTGCKTSAKERGKRNLRCALQNIPKTNQKCMTYKKSFLIENSIHNIFVTVQFYRKMKHSGNKSEKPTSWVPAGGDFLLEKE